MKQERNYPWYYFRGEAGVIAYIDEPLFNGVESLYDNGREAFFAFVDMPSEVESAIKFENVNDDYSGIGEGAWGEEIVAETVVSYGDSQRLIDDVFVEKSYWEDDLYVRELCTYTDSHYDWTSELTQFREEVRYAVEHFSYDQFEKEDFDTDEEYWEVFKNSVKKAKSLVAELDREWDRVLGRYECNYSLEAPPSVERLVYDAVRRLGYDDYYYTIAVFEKAFDFTRFED